MKSSNNDVLKKKLKMLLEDLKRVHNGKALGTRKLSLAPKFYLEIPIHEGKDRHHREGFVVELDPKDFKPTGASFYNASGPGTYTEELLTSEQFEILRECVGLVKMDFFSDFSKMIFK